MKIGILGGSFDPIHYGHIHMAVKAYEEYGLDQVWLMPAGHSPNKDEAKMAAAGHRVDMVRRAVSEYPFICVSTLETDSPERSYTYRTMEKLCERYPKEKFYFIMGADSLDYLEQWLHPEIICRLATILVVRREELEEPELLLKIREMKHLFPADIRLVHCKKYDISSREIREKIKKGEDVSKDIPPKVLDYITAHNLYQF